MPQPPLPDLPELVAGAMDREPHGAALAHRLLPRGLHRPRRPAQRPHPAQPRALLRPALRAGSQTLLELGADPKRLGAQLGATCVLHTWTRDLRFHAHLHCIVTGGGLNADGDCWLRPRSQDYLFPEKVLAKLFRGKLLDALAAAYQAGKLELKGSGADLADPKAFARLKDQLYKKNWVAYCKEPFAGPAQVFSYLGRYTHRVGISNQRLLDALGRRRPFPHSR